MRLKHTEFTPELSRYVVEEGIRQDEILRALAGETEALGDVAAMQVSPDEGALLTLLARTVGARRAIEIGTFTGYSGICIARGLAPEGRLLSLDVNEQWVAVARRYFRKARLDDRIDVRIAPAIEILKSLPEEEQFDFAFVDADKEAYPDYYEELLPRLRPGALLVVDNVFWGGSVADAATSSKGGRAIRRLNARIRSDPAVDVAMVPVADGVSIVRKRLPAETP